MTEKKMEKLFEKIDSITKELKASETYRNELDVVKKELSDMRLKYEHTNEQYIDTLKENTDMKRILSCPALKGQVQENHLCDWLQSYSLGFNGMVEFVQTKHISNSGDFHLIFKQPPFKIIFDSKFKRPDFQNDIPQIVRDVESNKADAFILVYSNGSLAKEKTRQGLLDLDTVDGRDVMRKCAFDVNKGIICDFDHVPNALALILLRHNTFTYTVSKENVKITTCLLNMLKCMSKIAEPILTTFANKSDLLQWNRETHDTLQTLKRYSSHISTQDTDELKQLKQEIASSYPFEENIGHSAFYNLDKDKKKRQNTTNNDDSSYACMQM
tara:strand:+ start:826 stop:1809 length:984 start_codon:yes stop_codon:yes gene_type:complete